jgi:beta-fructofuranosidase
MELSETVTAARDLRLKLLDDPYRPAFHFVVPEGLALPADPNGAIHWNGRYHLGYIYQEEGVHYWGHVSSLDLLHWRHHRPWLLPTEDSPETGIFSGNCFINREGEATILYHGVGSGNSIATSSDPLLDVWQKLPTNPIVPVEGDGVSNRPVELPYASWDPHGWLEGDTYYAIFGGTRPAVFRAETLGSWEHVGALFAHGVEGVDLAEDVSCPDLFRLGDRWVLLCISHALGCRYYIGDWKDEQFHPEVHEQMSWADNTLFAPESLLDPQGRRIMWAWMFDRRDEDARRASGWSGTLCLPRELWLDERDRLCMRPVEELARLRYHERSVADLRLESGDEVVLEGISGQLLDLELEVELHGLARFTVGVCCSADGEEATFVGYDAGAGQLFVDPSRASSNGWGSREVEAGPLELEPGEPLRLRILVDRSVVEAFANDRQAALRRVYPAAESVAVRISVSAGAATVRRLSAWDMMPSNPY